MTLKLHLSKVNPKAHSLFGVCLWVIIDSRQEAERPPDFCQTCARILVVFVIAVVVGLLAGLGFSVRFFLKYCIRDSLERNGGCLYHCWSHRSCFNSTSQNSSSMSLVTLLGHCYLYGMRQLLQELQSLF